MKKIVFLAILGLSICLVSENVFAQAGIMSKVKKQRWLRNKEAIYNQLNLTEEQKTSLKENKDKQKSQMMSLQKELQQENKNLKDALNSPSFSRRDLEPIAERIKKLEAKKIDLRINGILAVKEILTPEQFSKFQELVKGKFKGEYKKAGYKTR